MSKGSRLLFLTLLSASSLIIMAGATVAPILPALRKDFADTPNVEILVSLVLTLPALVIALTAPLMGYLADRFGRAKLLVAGLLLFVISGVSGFVVQSLLAMLLGRIGIGIAVAAVMTTASALLIDHSHGKARQSMVGYQGAAAGLAGLLFPLIAGVLAEGGWRLPFLAYLVPLILVPLAFLYVSDASKASEVSQASMADFPYKKAVKIYALAFFWMIVMYCIPLQMAHHLQAIGSGSSTTLGLAVGLPSFAAAMASFLFGRLRNRWSAEVLIAVAFGGMAIGYAVVGRSSELSEVLIGLVIAGLGFGLTMPNLLSWLQVEMPLGLRGRAAGGYTTATFLGQFSATFVYAALLSKAGAAASFSIVAVACFGVAFLWLISIPSQHRVVELPTR